MFSRIDFFAHLFNVWLNKRRLDSHFCSAFSLLQYVVLDAVHGEKLATSGYIWKRKHFVDLSAF